MATIGLERIEPTRKRQTFDWSRVRSWLSYALLFLLALAFLYPFLLAVTTSLKTLPEINARPVALILVVHRSFLGRVAGSNKYQRQFR